MNTNNYNEAMINALKDFEVYWNYVKHWMGLYDYECDNTNVDISDPHHSIDAIVSRLKIRWPEESVPNRQWFASHIHDMEFWKRIEAEDDEYMQQCNERYRNDLEYREEQDRIHAMLKSE